jgi:hypothetical protein
MQIFFKFKFRGICFKEKRLVGFCRELSVPSLFGRLTSLLLCVWLMLLGRVHQCRRLVCLIDPSALDYQIIPFFLFEKF